MHVVKFQHAYNRTNRSFHALAAISLRCEYSENGGRANFCANVMPETVCRSQPKFRTRLIRSINLATRPDVFGIQYIRRDAQPQVKSGFVRVRRLNPIVMFYSEMAFIHIAEMI